MLDREKLKQAFLADAGWDTATMAPVTGDASTRSYERLLLDGRKAILMNAPVEAEAAACPPEASVQGREALGYNAQARLAGPNMHAFTEIAAAIRAAGVYAPEIFASDPEHGFCLLEDLGKVSYAEAIADGADEA